MNTCSSSEWTPDGAVQSTQLIGSRVVVRASVRGQLGGSKDHKHYWRPTLNNLGPKIKLKNKQSFTSLHVKWQCVC